ncbi:hypothetical protein GGS24DRAFT_51376 [Hypoxylon argillaceum]|nr:hypothetical protein GGS24DRAFT_51376 [Hypoxylon argillaceum]
MANFGKFQGSVASFTNENTAALVNINLDFSLFRCETKAEYLPVGPALTVQRREEAETGQIHRTACTLGFLFQEMLPDTPSLFKAYGRRVSEILAQPNINPRGTAEDGPFRSYVGADCTSIWAAATSSDSSIAIHLLACMLARAFDSKTATSIWFEVVRERKEQIKKLAKDNKMIHPHTYLASQQGISRADLATWDTSARAWLRRADESKAWEKNQFALIVENVKLPFTAPGTTYSKVSTTWVKSMEVLNSLLDNLPQQANDRAILLAISSWHLHPNLLVFQNTATNVDMRDPLFPPSGILSLGLEYKLQNEAVNIRWSLALSHLRYYGAPVPVRSNEDLSRVSMSQFWFVALGSFLRTWNLRSSELLDAINWLDGLNKIISPAAGRQFPEIDWIIAFCNAATKSLESGQTNTDLGIRLVKFGWRRGRLFGEEGGTHIPYFGLRNPYILKALGEDDAISKGIVYLRGVVSGIELGGREVILSFSWQILDEIYYEWATVRSAQQTQEKVTNERWIHFSNDTNLSPHYRNVLSERCNVIRGMGEECHVISSYEDTPYSLLDSSVCWPNPPRALDSKGVTSHRLRPIPMKPELHYSMSSTQSQGYSIWVGDDAWNDSLKAEVHQGLRAVEPLPQSLDTIKNPRIVTPIMGYLRSITVPSVITEAPSRKRKRSTGGSNYDYFTINALQRTNAVDTLMIQHSRPSRSWLQSVMVLQIATLVYDQLPGATISLQTVEFELCKARWLPEKFTEIYEADDKSYHSSLSTTSAVDWFQKMTRAEAFGCIAMFESGRSNIRTEHLGDVIALCAEDSIFVAGILLRDPSIVPTSGPQVRRLIGSIGQAGLVLLVSPVNPRIRPTGYDPTSVEHKIYDGSREDRFASVSLHLSFTEWKMPLDWENTGEIDQEVFLLESVLSVMHNGQWVGDIDVLGLERDPIDVFENDCKGDCETDQTVEDALPDEVISLDDWEELIDPPRSVGVFRAKSNWVARLAVASILIQQNKGHLALVIGGSELCWKCLVNHYAYPEPHIPQFIID